MLCHVFWNQVEYKIVCFTSHPRVTVALLDTVTPGATREIYSDDADSETRIRNTMVINRVL